MNVMRNIVTAALMTVVTTLLLGIVYPLAITGIAQALFPDKANGQLIEQNGKVVGSRIIGQGFSSPGYFRSRPSAAGTGYDAANSAGTQLGPTNKKLIDNVKANVEAARKENASASVPIDLVTTSASGLDPHLSPAAADFQVGRVARERGMSESDVRALVASHTEGRQLGFSRRTASERARAQPRARCRPPHESARKVTWTSVRMKNHSQIAIAPDGLSWPLAARCRRALSTGALRIARASRGDFRAACPVACSSLPSPPARSRPALDRLRSRNWSKHADSHRISTCSSRTPPMRPTGRSWPIRTTPRPPPQTRPEMPDKQSSGTSRPCGRCWSRLDTATTCGTWTGSRHGSQSIASSTTRSCHWRSRTPM